MRIAIIGAGAMGTLLGHGFCKAGHRVSLVDISDRVAALRHSKSLTVISPDGSESSHHPALITDDFAMPGPQDYVFLATKAQQLPAIAKLAGNLLDPRTSIVTIQNGIPWWYLQDLEHGFSKSSISCLDPDGSLQQHISPSRIIGCVAYPAAMLNSDGKVQHVEGDRFPVGELDGQTRERTKSLVGLFESGGFRSRAIDDIRSEIWLKTLGATTINPVSALTRATMEDICTNPASRELISQMMHEVKGVAEACGALLRHTIDKRIEGARAVGQHKTSMLQDVEAGRELEIDAVMLAVIELAELAHVAVPTLRNIHACLSLLNDKLRGTLPVQAHSPS